MRRLSRMRSRLQVALMFSLLGGYSLAGFGGINCLGQATRLLNPCGTVLVCDPLEYDLMNYDLDDFPDFDVDPTCTIPGFCDGVPFPPAGQGQTGGDGGADTGGTTQ